MKRIVLPILLSLCCLQAFCDDGQSAYNFLTIPVSAHAAALGGNNVSIIEDDATMALSNPSLLSSVSHRTVSLGYMNYMDGVNMFTAGYTHVINDKATVGGAVRYLNYGSMKETDVENRNLGTFSPSDMAFEGIFSYSLAKNFVGGIGAKFIYSKIGPYSSTAAAIDLGINYYHPDKDFSASLVVRNLGGQLSAYDDEFEKLPIDLLAGVTYALPKMPFRLSLTFSDLTNWDYSFLRHASIGVDIILMPQFYLAAGFSARRSNDLKTKDIGGTETAHGAGWSFGGGLMLEHFKLNVSYGKYHVSSSSLMVNAAFSF